MKDQGRERAERAKRRAQGRHGKGGQESEGGSQWTNPDWQEQVEIPELEQGRLEEMVRTAIDTMRQRVAEDLKERAKTSAQKEAAEAFSAGCVASDFEVFTTSIGLQFMMAKYKFLLLQYAPELLTGGGLLMIFLNQRALRREAQKMAEQWETEASQS